MSSRKSNWKGSFGHSAPGHSRNPRNALVIGGRGRGKRTIWDNKDTTKRGIELRPRRRLNSCEVVVVPPDNTDSNVQVQVGGIKKCACHKERPLTVEPTNDKIPSSKVRICCEYLKPLGQPYSYEYGLELAR